MENLHRIHWKKGMDVTPEILIDSDNFHIAERNLLGRLLASRWHGLLPESKFSTDTDLYNNCILITSLACQAITQNGYVINIPANTPCKKELPLSDFTAEEGYVVLSVIPAAMEQIVEDESFILQKYDLALKSTHEFIENGIPVLKIIKNSSEWEIDTNYIPPSAAINSVPILKQTFTEIKNIINSIIEKFSENDVKFFQGKMLQIELNSYTGKESPEELLLLMKKLVWTFITLLTKSKKIEPSSRMKEFMDVSFHHNEIQKVLQSGIFCFREILELASIVPEEPKVEEPEIEEINV